MKLLILLSLMSSFCFGSGVSSGGGSGGGGGGVTTVGTIDSQSASGDGATISSTNIYMQSEDATHPGLVNNTTQTISGVKTFSSAPICSSLTATTVPYLNGSKALTSSAVTPTELGYVSGVTSAIQTQINGKQASGSYAASGANGDITSMTGLTTSISSPTFIDHLQVTTPANPAATHNRLYFKSGDHLFMLNSGGTETQVDGGGSGVTTMAAVGSTPSANGASIAGSTLTLQPADATHPGVVVASGTTQTLGGTYTVNHSFFTTTADTAFQSTSVTQAANQNPWIDFENAQTGSDNNGRYMEFMSMDSGYSGNGQTTALFVRNRAGGTGTQYGLRAQSNNAGTSAMTVAVSGYTINGNGKSVAGKFSGDQNGTNPTYGVVGTARFTSGQPGIAGFFSSGADATESYPANPSVIAVDNNGDATVPLAKFYQANALAAQVRAGGDISVDVAGHGLAVKEGSNAKQGTVTFNGTTGVVVSTTAVTSSSRIFITCDNPNSGVPGVEYVFSISAGTSFTVKSTAADTCISAWEIFEPA